MVNSPKWDPQPQPHTLTPTNMAPDRGSIEKQMVFQAPSHRFYGGREGTHSRNGWCFHLPQNGILLVLTTTATYPSKPSPRSPTPPSWRHAARVFSAALWLSWTGRFDSRARAECDETRRFCAPKASGKKWPRSDFWGGGGVGMEGATIWGPLVLYEPWSKSAVLLKGMGFFNQRLC